MRIDIGVPNRFRVNHCHWPGSAAAQTASLVNADMARACQAGGFDLRFAAVKAFLGKVVGAAVLTGFALVQAKKDVPLVVRRFNRVGGVVRVP